MGGPVELIPLVCFKCDTPVPAQPDEMAWVCAQCGQGLVMDETKGLSPMEIHYHAALKPDAKGKPYWVSEGQVSLARNVYGGRNLTTEAQQFWASPRLFFIPAYTCPLDTLTSLGTRLLLQPPALQDGPAAGFEPVTLSMADIQPMAEFIIMAIEADRRDNLKSISIGLQLKNPALWILPG